MDSSCDSGNGEVAASDFAGVEVGGEVCIDMGGEGVPVVAVVQGADVISADLCGLGAECRWSWSKVTRTPGKALASVAVLAL